MNLFDRILYGRRIVEDTTMANVTFLPSGLGAVKAAIKNLAKVKKDWNIEILETEKGKKVMFEDQLSIFVPEQWWDDFSMMFDEQLEHGKVGLYKYLNEAMEDEAEELREEIRPALTKMFEEKQFRAVDKAAEQWHARFGAVQYRPSKNVLVKAETKRQDIQRLVGAIHKAYGEDRGNLQILLEAISNSTTLNSFNIFKEKNFLYGTRILSRHDSSDLMFEATIGMDYIMNQSIIVGNEEVLDELAKFRNIKIVKNVIYPVNKVFDAQILYDLDDALEDVIDSGLQSGRDKIDKEAQEKEDRNQKRKDKNSRGQY